MNRKMPYTNFHDLNLDWIIKRIMNVYNDENPPPYPVRTVNGQVGNVHLTGDDIPVSPNDNTELSTKLSEKYTLPVGGIPLDDLAQAVIDAINAKYTKPEDGIPLSDLDPNVVNNIIADVVSNIIDDNAGYGDTDKTWSANKLLQIEADVVDLENDKVDKPAQTGTAGQVLGLNQLLQPEWINMPVADMVQAVNDWLSANISNPANPPLDRSLSLDTACAPADLVGALNKALGLEADRSLIDMSGFKPGDYAPYKTWDNAGLTHELYPGIFKINGTSTGGRLVSLLGNDSRYANATTCSANQLNQGPFKVTQGHQYKITLKRVAGSITDDTRLYLAVFDTDGSTVLAQAYENDEIIFTANTANIGQLCYFTYKNHTWTSCEYVYTFEDVTEALLNDIYYVPAYYNTHLATAISKINNDINAGKTVNYGTDIESFVFITDVHWNANKKHSPGLIKKLLNSCPIKTVVCGGDIIQNNAGAKSAGVAEIRSFTDSIVNIPCYDYFCVFGNHDDNGQDNNTLDNCFTKDEQFNILYAPFSDKKNVHWSFEDTTINWDRSNEIIKNDFYVDHVRTKTRYLCIDWNHPMSGNRVTWMQNVLSLNDGFRVIVIYHGIYSNNNGTLDPEHIAIMNILQPYKSKIVALFTGHAHMDGVVDYYGDGSVPVIVTSCDTFRNAPGYTEGTITEQCFDVVVVDYLNSKIKLTRIGRGNDREVNISVTV